MTDFNPDWVVPTSVMLRDWLDRNGVTTRIAAASCYARGETRDWAVDVLDAVLADEPINQGGFAVLAVVTGISAAFWEGFERNYRNGLAAGRKRAGS